MMIRARQDNGLLHAVFLSILVTFAFVSFVEAADDRYIVHGLDADAASVEKARNTPRNLTSKS